MAASFCVRTAGSPGIGPLPETPWLARMIRKLHPLTNWLAVAGIRLCFEEAPLGLPGQCRPILSYSASLAAPPGTSSFGMIRGATIVGRWARVLMSKRIAQQVFHQHAGHTADSNLPLLPSQISGEVQNNISTLKVSLTDAGARTSSAQNDFPSLRGLVCMSEDYAVLIPLVQSRASVSCDIWDTDCRPILLFNIHLNGCRERR